VDGDHGRVELMRRSVPSDRTRAARIRSRLAPLLLALAVGGLLFAQSAPWRGSAAHAAAPAVHGRVAAAPAAAVRVAAAPAAKPSVAPWPVAPPRSAFVDLGITNLPLAQNEWRQWSTADLGSVNAVEQQIRHHVSVVMWYADWAHNPTPDIAQLRAISARGSTPEITWEPWDDRAGTLASQPQFTLASIIDGHHDALIRTWATALARYGGTVRLRFAQEMNGRWYPWSEVANGNHFGEFVRAWRHVHDLFTAAGARNVQWVWSPVAIAPTAEQYPGPGYVDWVGLSGFNGGTQLRYGPWRPFGKLFSHSLHALERIAPAKPIEISEVGCAEKGGDKAAWITKMFGTLSRHPQIRSVVWFDLDKGSDWRVDSSAASLAAFRAGVANPRYR
jgi:beta-mannanase